jgi:hypothetical protein
MPGFDAKSILEAIVAGNSQRPAPSQGDLSSILNSVLHAGLRAGRRQRCPAVAALAIFSAS